MSNPIAYLCIQGWGNDVVGVEIGAPAAVAGIEQIQNEYGLTTYDLADFTTFELDTVGTGFTFTTTVDMTPDDADYDGSYTVALLGMKIAPSLVDTVVRCTLTVDSTEYHSAAAVYGQEMSRAIVAGTEGHELIGSGLANIVFHDLPSSILGQTAEFAVTFEDGFTAAVGQVDIGSIFVGLQIPLQINPRSFTWSEEMVNSQFESRALSNVSSDGVMRRICGFEAQLFKIDTLTGINSSFYSGTAPKPNLFRAAIANCGQPMLLSPYPYSVNDKTWGDTPDAAEVRERLLSVRQNFFSIYGLMDRRMDITVDEYNASLDSLYKSKIRFTEVR